MRADLVTGSEQLDDPADVRASASGGAVVASLLLHLSIGALIVLGQPNAGAPQTPEHSVALLVTTISVNPQRRNLVPADTNIASPSVSLEPASDQKTLSADIVGADVDSEAGAAAGQPLSTLVESSDDQPKMPGQIVELQTTATVSDSDVALPALEINESVQNRAAPAIDAAEISKSVTAYVTNYKGTLTNNWLSGCLRYQNEHGVKTCPPAEEGRSETANAMEAAAGQMFSTYVTGASDNARASRQLVAEMDAARVHLKENTIMGELARQRYALAEAHYCKLNGCRLVVLGTGQSFNTPVSNEGGIGILTIGGNGKVSLLAGLMTFSFKDGVRFMDTATGGPRKTFVPYSFTQKPPPQAAREDEFKVETPLFPVSR